MRTVRLDRFVVPTERPVQAARIAHANQLDERHAQTHAGQYQRLGLEQIQQLRHAAGGERMRHIAADLIGGNLLAAVCGQRRIVEHLLPVGRSVGAAALQLRLQQLPGLLVVLVVVQRAIEALRHQRAQLAVLHVAGNADADLSQENDDQKDGELPLDGDGRKFELSVIN